MPEEIEFTPTEAELLREMNRRADTMASRGLAALMLRELARLREPTSAELDEWQEFAKANAETGGIVGELIPDEYRSLAKKRADETISAVHRGATITYPPGDVGSGK